MTAAAAADSTSPLLVASNVTRHYTMSRGWLKPKAVVRALDGVSFTLGAGRTCSVWMPSAGVHAASADLLATVEALRAYERVDELNPLVVKKDGRREAFDRDKLLMGLKKACEKRPVSVEQLEEIITGIERKLQETGEKEIPSTMIGEEVMRLLPALDEVAYVRFASVYRSFRDIAEFMDELKEILEGQERLKKVRK